MINNLEVESTFDHLSGVVNYQSGSINLGDDNIHQ